MCTSSELPYLSLGNDKHEQILKYSEKSYPKVFSKVNCHVVIDHHFVIAGDTFIFARMSYVDSKERYKFNPNFNCRQWFLYASVVHCRGVLVWGKILSVVGRVLAQRKAGMLKSKAVSELPRNNHSKNQTSNYHFMSKISEQFNQPERPSTVLGWLVGWTLLLCFQNKG